MIDGIKKDLKTRLNFGNAQGPNGPYKNIELYDDTSGLLIAKIDIPHEQFGIALSSVFHGGECTTRLYQTDNFGKQYEAKEELVSVNLNGIFEGKKARELILKASKSHEVDGWIAGDSVNLNRYSKVDKKYPVTFRRYVEIKDED